LSIESKALELLTFSSSESSSEKELNVVLDQHWKCFSGEVCSVCEWIDEDFDSLIDTMAKNPASTSSIQKRLYDAALMRPGGGYGFLLSLAGNPSITDHFKVLCLDCEVWASVNEGFSEMARVLQKVLAAFESNDVFSKEEVKTFQKQFKATYDYVANTKLDLKSIVEKLDKWAAVYAPTSAAGITHTPSWKSYGYLDETHYLYYFEEDYDSRVFWEYSRELMLSGMLAAELGLREFLPRRTEGDFGAWILEIKLGANPKAPQIYTSCLLTLIRPSGDEIIPKKISQSFIDRLRTI